MDIEKALMNELAENGTDKARDLFLKWQESRIQAKEMLLGKLEQVKESDSLPCVRLSLPDPKTVDSHDVDAFLDGYQQAIDEFNEA